MKLPSLYSSIPVIPALALASRLRARMSRSSSFEIFSAAVLTYTRENTG